MIALGNNACRAVSVGDAACTGVYVGDAMVFPDAPTYDETKIAVIWLENDEPTETIEYFDTLSDARSYMYSQYAADRRFWVRLGKQLPTMQEFTSRYFSTFPCVRKFTAYSGIDILPSNAFEGSPNLKEVYTNGAGFVFEDANENLVLSEGVFNNCQSLEKIEIVGTTSYLNSKAALNSSWIGYTSQLPKLKTVDFSIPTYGVFNFAYPVLETFTMRKLYSKNADLDVSNGGKVGNEAFKGCTTLRNVDISATDALYVLGEAFAGCTALENVSLSYDVSQGGEIASDAFTGCDGVTITINAPENSISGAPWGATNAEIIWTG